MKSFRYTILSIILSWLVACIAAAQPTWLKQVMQEAEAVSTDAEAGFIVLHSTAEVKISAYGRSITHVRRACKIIKPSVKAFGLFVEHVTSFRKVKSLTGWMLSPDDRLRALPKECFVEADVQRAATTYEDTHMLLAKLDNLETGAIVAFEYKIEQNGLTSFFHSFEFQNRQPVRFAQLAVNVPAGWKLNHAQWGIDHVAFAPAGNRYVWTAKDLPFQPEATPMPSPHSLAKCVAVAYYDPYKSERTQFSDWPSVARWCAENFDARALPDDSVTAFVRQLTRDLQTPEEKLRIIAAFVRDEIRYVAVEIGTGRWQPRSAAVTLHNRYGDCKDKTTLMRAMLHAVGISSSPVLTNTQYPVQATLPTLFQFDHCVIAIPLRHLPKLELMPNASAGGWLFFDPTDPSTALGELPKNLQGTLVLTATAGDSLLHRLPYCTPEDYRRHYHAEAYLQPDGAFSAKVKITDYGKWAAESRYQRHMTTSKEQIEKWRTFLSQTAPVALSLSNYATGENNDSAWVSFQLQGDRYSVQAGALYFLKADFFQTDEQRHDPLWHGPSKRIETDIRWHLSKAWVAETEVAPIKSVCGEASLACEVIVSGETLHVKSVIQRAGKPFSPGPDKAAGDFQQDLRAISGLMIVLRKLENWSAL
jgi:hypothetical protein